MPADSRQGAHGRPKLTFLLLPVLLIGGVTGIFLYLKQDDAGSRRLDADLCQTEGGGIAGSATLLLDFRKPLEAAQLGVPGALLHDLSLELGANTELRVFVLTADAAAPRQALARVCKPYDNADLSIPTAKDQRNIVRDCDDLPAQLPGTLRAAASSFCTRRDALRRRIDALARRSGEEPIANAYLVEALDATEMEFADRPAPHALYIFSDMLQHAPWYSHLELGWTDWSFENFAAMREVRYPSFGRWPAVAGQFVKVFYVPAARPDHRATRQTGAQAILARLLRERASHLPGSVGELRLRGGPADAPADGSRDRRAGTRGSRALARPGQTGASLAGGNAGAAAASAAGTRRADTREGDAVGGGAQAAPAAGAGATEAAGSATEV